MFSRKTGIYAGKKVPNIPQASGFFSHFEHNFAEYQTKTTKISLLNSPFNSTAVYIFFTVLNRELVLYFQVFWVISKKIARLKLSSKSEK